MRPLSPCAVRGCPQRAVRRGLCAQHADESDARYRATHPDMRPNSSARGYNAQWREMRKAFLSAHPMCNELGCHERATHVDHIVPKSQGGKDEPPNFQALCHRHHSIKTNQVDGGFGNPKVG